MYEEIMSDEEELPEFPYGAEEWVVEEWEDWLPPPPPPRAVQQMHFPLKNIRKPTLTKV